MTMSNLDSPAPSQDERVMAALAHVSALLPLMGVVAPIVVWATQKDKSRFVAFQALQAVVYQLSMVLAWFLGMGCYVLSFFSLFAFIPFAGSETSQTLPPLFLPTFFIPFVVMGLMLIGGLAFVVYGLIAAILVFQGKPFRYILIGRWVERFIQPKPGTPSAPPTSE
jgi:uncharacterized protein